MSGIVGWDELRGVVKDEQPGPGEHRFTVFLGWDYGEGSKPKGEKWSSVEEVDVNARTADEAKDIVEKCEIYTEGGVVFHVEGPRIGLYF